MARLKALPSLDIIRGFKGTLDFYMWKGLPCVRKWPVRAPGRRTAAEIASSLLFGAILQAYRLLAPEAHDFFQEDSLDQPRTPRDIYVSAVLGHLHQRTIPPPPPPPEEEMYDAYVCLRDLKPQNTTSGTFTAGDWRTRDLTDEQADTADICALAANQFTLPAGTYHCSISCPAFKVNNHQARLYNVTDDTTILLGTSERSYGTDQTATRSHILGRFTLAAEKTIQVQHRCSYTCAGDGFGWQCNFTDEIYTVAEFWRELEAE